MRALAILSAAVIVLLANGFSGLSAAYAQSATKPSADKSSKAARSSSTAKTEKTNAAKPQRTGGERRVKSSPALDHAGAPGYE